MGHDCKIVIRTKDGKAGKRFVIRDGRCTVDDRIDDYDAAMIWKDGWTGFIAMLKGDDGIRKAMADHVVSIDGNIHDFTWFGAALKFVMES